MAFCPGETGTKCCTKVSWRKEFEDWSGAICGGFSYWTQLNPCFNLLEIDELSFLGTFSMNQETGLLGICRIHTP